MYQFYKLFHLVGIMLFLSGLSGMLLLFYEKPGAIQTKSQRLARICRVTGIICIILGGLGMLFELGVLNLEIPKWALAKVVVFFLFGPVIGMAIRQPKRTPILIPIFILLGGTAAFFGLYKPF